MVLRRLTAEQQRLVEENLKLVPFAISRRFGVNFANDEDVLQDGYVGLCSAAACYDPAAGPFSTYAVKTIEHAVEAAWRYSRGRKRHIPQELIRSLNDVVSVADDGDPLTYLDIIPDMSTSYFEDAAMDRIICEPLREIAPIAARIVDEQITFREYGERIGVSRQCVQQKTSKECERARRIFGGVDRIRVERRRPCPKTT